jgi:hypothetical protein
MAKNRDQGGKMNNFNNLTLTNLVTLGHAGHAFEKSGHGCGHVSINFI